LEDAWHQLVRFSSSGFSDTGRLDELFDHTGMADSFRGKAMTLVAECFGFHHASLPNAS